MDDSSFLTELNSRISSGVASMDWWAKCWTGIYHSCLFGAAFLSAGAVTVLQLPWFEEPTKTAFASILSACAALAGVVAAGGGFQRKWHTCRATRGRLLALEIDLIGPMPKLDPAKECLKSIWKAHEVGITGVPAAGDASPPSPRNQANPVDVPGHGDMPGGQRV